MKQHIHITLQRATDMAYGPRSEQKQLCAVIGMPLERVRYYIGEMLKEGFEVIPAEGCDNAAPTGRCLGHPSGVGV